MGDFGKIIWQDLTVDNADQIRDFYSEVVGWKFENVNMGDHNDYNMIRNDDENQVVAGICHKKGSLVNFPSQWLNYVEVKNLESSIVKCKKLGGKIIEGPKKMGNSTYVIIQDPAGAYMALMENG